MPECRHLHCRNAGQFKAEIPKRFHKRTETGGNLLANEGWDGVFCQLHLLNVLELKLADVGFHDQLVIEKVA